MVGQSPATAVCNKGMSINPYVIFSDCPPLDFLLVPGGQGTRREVDNSALINFVAEQAEHCREVLLVCTGAFILHRAHCRGKAAGRVQLAMEYYPSSKSYGMMHEHTQMPVYVKEWRQDD